MVFHAYVAVGVPTAGDRWAEECAAAENAVEVRHFNLRVLNIEEVWDGFNACRKNELNNFDFTNSPYGTHVDISLSPAGFYQTTIEVEHFVWE
jgi:hypothetical protein